MMRSLVARTYVGAVLLFCFAVGFSWTMQTRFFVSFVSDSYQRELQAVADSLVAGLVLDDKGASIGVEPSDPRFNIPAGGRYWQVSGLKDGLQRSRSLWDKDLVPGKPAAWKSPLTAGEGPDGNPVLMIETQVVFERNGAKLPVRILVGAGRDEFDEAKSKFNRRLLQNYSILGLVTGMMTAVIIRLVTGNLGHLSRAVTAIRQGQASQMEDKGDLEVRRLVTEINTLLEAERAAVERARAWAADLAHGLKTPLTILSHLGETLEQQGDVERARRIAEQVSTMRSRTDRQLALARSGARVSTAFDATQMIGRLAAVVRPLGQARGISIECLVPEGLMIMVDATDFAEAVGNVVDNAMRHARSRVRISGLATAKACRITVADDGMGIAEGDREAALTRGERLDASSGGSGLGLAITADILRTCGGSISLDSSALGGLAVHLDWPLAQPATSS